MSGNLDFLFSLGFSPSFFPDSEVSVRRVIFPSCGRAVSVKFRWVISEGVGVLPSQTPWFPLRWSQATDFEILFMVLAHTKSVKFAL